MHLDSCVQMKKKKIFLPSVKKNKQSRNIQKKNSFGNKEKKIKKNS